MTSTVAAPTAVDQIPKLGRRLRTPAAGAAAAAAFWLFLTANFNALFLWGGDATRPYSFLQRMFGDTTRARGYQFGLAFFEAPFYALAKLLRAAGVAELGGHPIAPALVSLGTSLYVLAAGAVGYALLGRLRLMRRGLPLAAAVVGSPLVYYGLFSTGQSHPIDALLFTVVVALTWSLTSRSDEGFALPLALGAVLGLSVSVRYISGVEAMVLVPALAAFARIRAAVAVAAGAALSFGLLALVPISLGVGLNSGSTAQNEGVPSFVPLSPLRMLFTDHRGLFVWSPVALLAVGGFFRLLRTRPQHRQFLVLTGLMALAIVASYGVVPFWDGTWSFSQRFYTPLFPVIAIGLAGLAEWRPRVTQLLACAAAAWSLFLALTLQTLGPPHGDYSTVRGGASDLAREALHSSPGAYLWGIGHLSHLDRIVSSR